MTRKNFFQKIAIGRNRKENSKARFLQLFTWVSDEKLNIFWRFIPIIYLRAENFIEIG